MVTNTSKIVHQADEFKVARRGSGSRLEPLEDHLVGVARRPLALLGRAHGPSQERQAEDIAGDPGGRRRQLVHPIGDEVGPGAEAWRSCVMPRRCSAEASGHSSSVYSRSATMPRAAGHARATPAPGRDQRTSRPQGRNRRRAPLPSVSTSLRSPSMTFDLNHQRHAAGDERAEIAQRHHPLRRS